MVNKITNFSVIAMEISENQYAQTLLMSQLRTNILVDSLGTILGKGFVQAQVHTEIIAKVTKA